MFDLEDESDGGIGAEGYRAVMGEMKKAEAQRKAKKFGERLVSVAVCRH
jgi:hypothetical protein